LLSNPTFPVNEPASEFQSYVEIVVSLRVAIDHLRVHAQVACKRSNAEVIARPPTLLRYDSSAMRAHVYRNNFFDDTYALARQKTHGDFHPNALFDSSFQTHFDRDPAN
jgi:hypothetical protein